MWGGVQTPPPTVAVAEMYAIAYKCIDSIDLDRLSGAFFWHRPGSDSSISITDILYIVESYPIY
jgi:hypothetical protein